MIKLVFLCSPLGTVKWLCGRTDDMGGVKARMKSLIDSGECTKSCRVQMVEMPVKRNERSLVRK